MPLRNFLADRLDAGESLTERAERIGVHRRTLEQVEAGKMPSPRLAKRIADFYGLKVSELWDLEADPPEQVAS